MPHHDLPASSCRLLLLLGLRQWQRLVVGLVTHAMFCEISQIFIWPQKKKTPPHPKAKAFYRKTSFFEIVVFTK